MEDQAKYNDEIELLELLIEDFDQRMMNDKFEELNPVELLRSLLRDSNIAQSELARSINVSKQLISDVLSYRRNISKELMLKLAAYFSMDVTAFSRPYHLEADKDDQPNNLPGQNA